MLRILGPRKEKNPEELVKRTQKACNILALEKGFMLFKGP